MDELAAEIQRIAGDAIQAKRGGWGQEHEQCVAAIKSALMAHADAGGFAKWGVTRDKIAADVTVSVGFDSTGRLFTINPEAMAAQMLGRP